MIKGRRVLFSFLKVGTDSLYLPEIHLLCDATEVLVLVPYPPRIQLFRADPFGQTCEGSTRHCEPVNSGYKWAENNCCKAYALR